MKIAPGVTLGGAAASGAVGLSVAEFYKAAGPRLVRNWNRLTKDERDRRLAQELKAMSVGELVSLFKELGA
jgi:hypothetical protein